MGGHQLHTNCCSYYCRSNGGKVVDPICKAGCEISFMGHHLPDPGVWPGRDRTYANHQTNRDLCLYPGLFGMVPAGPGFFLLVDRSERTSKAFEILHHRWNEFAIHLSLL